MTSRRRPAGTFSNDELKKLKASWKLADKLTLVKYLAKAPGTIKGVKILFKVTLTCGIAGFGYKMWSDARMAEHRAAGLFLSDLEERKLAELQRQNN